MPIHNKNKNNFLDQNILIRWSEYSCPMEKLYESQIIVSLLNFNSEQGKEINKKINK